MAYDPNNMLSMSYANGRSHWHYDTEDSLTEVNRRDYFNGAAELVRVGDFIFVSAGGTGSVLLVNANAGDRVSVADLIDPTRANGRRAAA